MVSGRIQVSHPTSTPMRLSSVQVAVGRLWVARVSFAKEAVERRRQTTASRSYADFTAGP